MFSTVRLLIKRQPRATAQMLAKDLEKRGIARNEITYEHIRYIYSLLKKTQGSPDWFSIENILLESESLLAIKNFPVLAVIVETRQHPSLDFVVSNILSRTKLPVQIFHGRENLEFIMSTLIAKHARDGRVYLTQLDVDKLSADKYNALFLSKGFWQSLIARKKILVFQTDAIVCDRSSYTINDFIFFDYIGSKWNRERPVGLIIDGGNGGLSIRDWKLSHECLERFPSKYWTGGEDGYFAFHIDLIGGKVGKPHECAKFSTQHDFLFKSWGAHKISCLNSQDQKAFLKYCEEASFMCKT